MSEDPKASAIIHSDLPDIVRDYMLVTQYDGSLTVHYHDDPDAGPLAPRRVERWKKVRTLGYGGQGQVVLETCVEGSRTTTHRAVKKIRIQDGDVKRRYERELSAILKFSHDKYSKHFVKCLGWFASSTKLYITMEYLAAGDLATYVQRNGSLLEADCQHIGSQILTGLALMHTEGFAHRDIKPQNILIYRCPENDPPGSWWVKLADFGISKRSNSNESMTTFSSGTFAYMAPELLGNSQMSGSVTDSQMADLWAFGVTIFYLLTGVLPFQNRYVTTKYAEDSGNRFPNGILDHSQVCQEGQEFVREALRPKPEERFTAKTAMQHSWIRALLPEVPVFSISRRPSTFSSRRSSFEALKGLTTEISNTNTQPFAHASSDQTPDTTRTENAPQKVEDDAEPVKSSDLTTVSNTKNDYPLPVKMQDILNQGDLSWKLLSKAVANGEVELVQTLLDNGIDPTVSSTNGLGLLHLSTFLGRFESIKLLHACGASLEAKSAHGETPLLIATRKGNEESVKLFLEMGADVETKNNSNLTPLSAAVQNGNQSMARLLVHFGAQVDARPHSHQTPKQALLRGVHNKNNALLQDAVDNNNAAQIKLLLELGADINMKHDFTDPPLIGAVEKGNEELVRLLIEKDADIEIKSRFHQTPLIAAIANRHTDISILLLDLGANVEERDYRGRTAFHHALKMADLAMVNLLQSKGVDYKAIDGNGRTSLMYAVQGGLKSLVNLLMDRGCDINARDNGAKTALMFASGFNWKAVAILLLEKGADIDAEDQSHRTALVIASQMKNKEMLDLLLERGAKRNAVYLLSLMALSSKGYSEIFGLF